MKSRFYFLHAILAVIFLSQLSAFAQSNTPTPKVPAKPIEIQKVATQKNISRTPVLLPAAKLNLVRQLFKGKIPPQTLDSLKMSTPISLSVRDGYLDNQAYL